MVLSTDLLSCRPARLVGRYDNSMPKSTLFLVHVLVAVHGIKKIIWNGHGYRQSH